MNSIDFINIASENGFNIAEGKAPKISAFSINVLDGNDTQIIYAIDDSASVSVYDWYDEKEIRTADNNNLSSIKKQQIIDATLKLQQLFGLPINIKFVFENEILYIVKISSITHINFTSLKEQFTNANFRDGGVSARPCNAFLSSLYKHSYHNTLKKFFIATKAFKEKNITPQIRKFGGKLYWNVSSCKTACQKLPGFIERDYDKDLGIYLNYEGKGKTSKITPLFLLRLPFIGLAVYKTLKKNRKELEKNKQGLLGKYHHYNGIDLCSLLLQQKQILFKKLILDYYSENEGVYFWQVFVNIIRLSLYRRKIKKKIFNDEYLNLLFEINDISHTRIIKRAEEYAVIIKEDPNALEELAGKLNQEFGHHSRRELDLTCPDYHENISYAIELIKNATIINGADDRFESQNKLLPKKLKKATASIRKFLWWREEFKDLSTRCYSVIRKFCLSLANNYVEAGVIEHKDDIFHLEFKDIFDFIDGKLEAKELQQIIQKNKLYYDCFVKICSPNEIGGESNVMFGIGSQTSAMQRSEIFGIGCGGGIVKGVVRVIESLEELESVEEGEIIIAKHFDAGFISKFNIIAGIITETGGVLCHSAIIAREYSLPAIVSASDALKQIKTGDKIEMNAQSGSIKLLD
ncbi:MAG: PEP-utilizing enzyme [Firmicutes bacterium]|nr:PEP-utilizing enzyme [Bacillota bacterium]